MRRRLALIGLGVILVSAGALDGPLWLLAQPSGADPAVRWDMARLHSWRGSTRARAAMDLKTHGPGAAMAAPLLVQHLDDVGWTDFHQGLSTMFAFHGGPSIVRTKAGEALTAMGPAAVPALIDGMRNPSEQVRMFAAELLGQAGDTRALPALRATVLGDQSNSVLNIAAKSLRELHDRSLFDQVAARLHDPDPKRRLMAPSLVESIGGVDAIPLLREAAQDSDPSVRIAAEGALRMAVQEQ